MRTLSWFDLSGVPTRCGMALPVWPSLDKWRRCRYVRDMSKYRNLDLERSAALFKALGHPHRLAIFLRMVQRCTPGTLETETESAAAVGELAAGLDIAPSTVSHHMKELRHAGLIHMRRAGQATECWVEPEALRELAAFFGGTVPESRSC